MNPETNKPGMKIYLAGPIFSEADQDWLRKAKVMIEEWASEENLALQVIWPYELIDKEEISALGSTAKHEIFRICRKHLDDADVLIALLDGSQVDDGTAFEIGYFFASKGSSRIIGIRTDFRHAGETADSCVNAMIECACGVIVDSFEGTFGYLGRLVKG